MKSVDTAPWLLVSVLWAVMRSKLAKMRSLMLFSHRHLDDLIALLKAVTGANPVPLMLPASP